MCRSLVQRNVLWKFLLVGFLLNLCLLTTVQAQVSVAPVLSGIPDLTPPEFATARAVEDLCPNLNVNAPGGQSDLKRRCDELVVNSRLNNQQPVRNSLLQMTTKEASSLGTSSIELSTLQFTNIATRITALRRGATGISLLGIALHDAERTPVSPMVASLWPGQDRAIVGDGGAPHAFPRFTTSSPDSSSESMRAQSLSAGSTSASGPNPFGRLGLFVNGLFGFGDKDTTSREAGFDFDTYGVTGGVDYRFTDNVVLGLAFGYTTTDSDFAAARGNMDADAYAFSAFGTYYVGMFYVDGIFTYGWNDYDSSRNIVYAIPTTNQLATTTVNQSARSETDGTQYSFALGTGYDFTARGFTFGPYGRLSYLKADIDGFQERIDNTSAGFGLTLAVNDQDVESLTWVLGGQASYALSTGFGVLVPQVRFEWEHEFLDNRRTIRARFISDPLNTPILLETDNPDRDYFNLGAGMSATFQRGVSAFAYYETVLALRDVTAHSITLGIRLAF